MKAAEIREQYNAANKERLTAYQQVFDSEAGQQVLKDLHEQFYDVDLLNKTSAHATHYNLGLRDVVRYINEMLEVASHAE